MAFNHPHIVKIKRIADLRGNLAVIEQGREIGFKPERCYWLTDVPSGENRDGHAYRTASELIVALAGCFDVNVETPDGYKESFRMHAPDTGLLVPPLVWRRFSNFTTNAVALVVSSTSFRPEDYIRNHNEFINFNNG
ncbi:MAG: FdtA/QdtA family cupin domain-containing protein [Firmicutes bacterium]|nr:FdtA/QdtA family cupin domain-containing protein [Bacillota bacterium]MCM1401613.1 FdtA/QdtA family cupin domain-containing protein [Bacteroides sp.]MCM1477768.1 FdtA/QdtA family cupin domain-containing protein [Bacteroides sp.]